MWVLLAHSIVPHVHESLNDSVSISEVSDVNEANIWSQIWDAIQFDPGEEHLEHFNQGQQLLLHAAIGEISDLLPAASWVELHLTGSSAKEYMYPIENYIGNTHRRGPPAI